MESEDGSDHDGSGTRYGFVADQSSRHTSAPSGMTSHGRGYRGRTGTAALDRLPLGKYRARMADITTVGILGSGIMGAGLAEVAARAGYTVVVRSRSQASADAMVASIDKGLAKQVERGKLEEAEKSAILGRITGTDHLGALRDCDLVIESVVEDLAVKKELFAELEQVVQSDAILATNTSTLPVVEMAMATQRADKVCGIHFFNPAPAMKLVEIVRPLTASDETIAAATEFAVRCGKDAVQVADRAGFVVNALFVPLPEQCCASVGAGHRGDGGHRHRHEGRLQLPDGTVRAARPRRARHLARHPRRAVRGVPRPELRRRPTLRRMVTAGQLGRKTKKGFYSY